MNDLEPKVGVLFVCLGNICRSPTAEGVFRAMVKRAGLDGAIQIESCGTGGWHVGGPADPRSLTAAKGRGYDLSSHIARQLTPNDFHRFEYIVVMDRSNKATVLAEAPQSKRSRVSMLLDHAPGHEGRGVPDPYQEGEEGFQLVLDLVEKGCRGLLERIIEEHDLRGVRA